MTLTKFLNVFILQLFFIRLTKHMDKDPLGEYTIIKAVSLQYWVVPFTGWWSNFKYIGVGPKFRYLT